MSHRELWLVRHAQAAFENAGGTDFDRPLTSEGKREAAALVQWLRRMCPKPDAIVSSPAPRSVDTAESLTLAWPAKPPGVVLEPRLYEAPLDGPACLIREFPETWRRVIVVGHNPSISHCADWLIGQPTVLELPAAALVRLTLDVPVWRDIAPGDARLHSLYTPDSAVAALR